MRSRLTAHERLTDNLYLSQSVPVRVPRVKKGLFLLSMLAGMALFLIFCFVFIAIFAP